MADQLRIAVLDAVPEDYWKDDEGFTDSQKFVDLLSPVNPAASFDIYYSTQNQFPETVDAYDGFLITGSPASVNDDFDWIDRLSKLIITADSRNRRIIGSCFGHQLVAKTFGGEVGKSESGWMIGNYRINITRQLDWMLPPAASTDLYHFNQERVVRLPEPALAFAESESYPGFGFTLGENIMCLQGHPEQPLRAMNNFLAVMSNLSQAEAARARDKIMDGKPDAQIWAQWMMRFFEA